MARVFLSYARDDAELAKQLAGLIAQSGHDVWWDRDIQGGQPFLKRDRQGACRCRRSAGAVDPGLDQVRLGTG